VEFANPRYFYIPRTHYVDGPGGTMKVWVKEWHTVKFEVHLEREVQTEFKMRDFLARVRKMINQEITEEHTVETGHEYQVHIKNKKYGNMRYRVFGYRIGFQQWRVLDNCGMLKVVSGIASVPTRKEGWQYWETNRP
jgi:mRNA-degrading endonuclease RelE of RelBE toxin-antitoxin system